MSTTAMTQQGTVQCLALDFGASSCRLISVSFQDSRLTMRELYRMTNGPVKQGDHLVWPLDQLVQGTIEALCKAGAENEKYQSIAADTWGVDYILLGDDGCPIAPPIAYRDSRTDGLTERFIEDICPRDKIYAKTGIQFLPFNTLYQLYAQTLTEPEVLQKTKSLLFIADYFHFLLSGRATIEKTMASTSQMWNLRKNCWDKDLTAVMALPKGALADPVEPGSEIGQLTPELQKKTGLPALRVIAPASHDTASAVLAVPARGENWAYLSSGTWSLLGIEITDPITSREAMDANWTNEGGYANTFRFLKNITGLWIIQEIARNLEGRYSFGELAEMAQAEPGFITLINPDDPRFFSPESMITAIGEYSSQTGQPIPETPGALVRCAYDSLSLLYRKTLEDLRSLSGKQIDTLHVVGGGSQANFLNQMTASTTGLPVLAGPVEATALGNALVQFLTSGAIASLAEGRVHISNSFPIKHFTPKPIIGLEEVYSRFKTLVSIQPDGKD